MHDMFKESIQKEVKDNYTIMKEFGFVRPTADERKIIAKIFEDFPGGSKGFVLNGHKVHSKGFLKTSFDLITEESRQLLLDKKIDSTSLIIYELKTTYGSENGLLFSFGITEGELLTWKLLGDEHYKLVLLNGNSKEYLVENFSIIGNYYTHASYFFSTGRGKHPIDLDSLCTVAKLI